MSLKISVIREVSCKIKFQEKTLPFDYFQKAI